MRRRAQDNGLPSQHDSAEMATVIDDKHRHVFSPCGGLLKSLMVTFILFIFSSFIVSIGMGPLPRKEPKKSFGSFLKKDSQGEERLKSDQVIKSHQPMHSLPDSPAKNHNVQNIASGQIRQTSHYNKIPRRLIFTYKYNLLAPSKDNPPFNPKDPLTLNVLRTIEKYTKFWENMDTGATSRLGSPTKGEMKEKVQISFLSDADCIVAIEQVEPRLVTHFQNESRGEFKADICRVAALYLDGGYYFDIDLGVVNPVDLDSLSVQSTFPMMTSSSVHERSKNASGSQPVTFATVLNKQGRFFQAFTAAMAMHPLLRKSMEYFLAYYEDDLEKVLPQSVHDSGEFKKYGIPSREQPQGMGVGPFAMKAAYDALHETDWENFVRGIHANQLQIGNGKVDFPKYNRYSSLPAKKRYSRFLYEISLEDKMVVESGIFNDVPRQDAGYKQKVKWCNFVCFEESVVYFYSRVKGSKGCPVEKPD